MIIAAIQARMGSKRLPKKVLTPVLGEPLIWRIYERLNRSKYIDKVIIASTNSPDDTELENFASDRNIGIYRGKVDDIVDRLYHAALKFEASVFVRIWGDCVYVDPEIVDQGIKMMLNENLDFVNDGGESENRMLPGGIDFEIYKFDLLQQMYAQCDNVFLREFPAEYIKANLDRLNTEIVSANVDNSKLDLSIDYPEDLELAQIIYSRLYKNKPNFGYRDVLKIIEEEPALVEEVNKLGRNLDFFSKKEQQEAK